MQISLRRGGGSYINYRLGESFDDGANELPLLGPGEPRKTVEVSLEGGWAWRGDRDERQERRRRINHILHGYLTLTPEEAKELALHLLQISGDNEDILKQLYRRETALANDLLGLSGGNEDILERVGNQVTELRRAIDGLGTQLRSFNDTIELLPGNRSE
jgi:hypothetical protein